MDMVLVILVLGAVIFFGALISAGNERQRKAIDGIREQAALWAMQDLRLKREKLAREVQVDDPIAWLNRVVAKVVGEDLQLTVTEIFDNPQALVCTTREGRKVIFSPVSPQEIQRGKRQRKSKLSQVGYAHPLWNLTHNARAEAITLLNGGLLFDLELPVAWKSLTGLEPVQEDQLCIYSE